tara:strand:+ start:472 stop:1632 length:1161 start_codon:yes stop_codon:yes gene_type:complete
METEVKTIPASLFQSEGDVIPAEETASTTEATTETTETTESAETTEVTTTESEAKSWESEWKKNFEDEDVETVKSYKTKAQEYEAKLAEREAEMETLFANDNIKKLNELAKNGVNIDENTVAFLNKDYNKITEPTKLISEYLKTKNPEWSDKKVAFEISKRYGLDRLKQEKDEDGELIELTDEQKELKEIIDEDLSREANEAKSLLQEEQDKLRLFKPEQKSKEQVEAERMDAQQAEQKWSEMTKEISSKHPTIKVEFSETPIVINGKPVKLSPIDYAPTKEDKAAAEKLFHGLGNLSVDENPLLTQFADKDGNLNNDTSRSKIFEYCLNVVSGNKIREHIAASAYKTAYEMAIKTDKKATDTLQNGKRTSAAGGVIPFEIFNKPN